MKLVRATILVSFLAAVTNAVRFVDCGKPNIFITVIMDKISRRSSFGSLYIIYDNHNYICNRQCIYFRAVTAVR